MTVVKVLQIVKGQEKVLRENIEWGFKDMVRLQQAK